MTRTPWFWAIAAIGLAALLAGGGLERWGIRSPRAEAEARQEALRQLREQLDGCVAHLGALEERFWTHEARTHDLRDEIDTYESLDPEGVPADRYDDYLKVLDGYNDAIDLWEARADSLRELEARCRDLAERYEEEREGLSRFLSEEDLISP